MGLGSAFCSCFCDLSKICLYALSSSLSFVKNLFSCIIIIIICQILSGYWTLMVMQGNKLGLTTAATKCNWVELLTQGRRNKLFSGEAWKIPPFIYPRCLKFLCSKSSEFRWSSCFTCSSAPVLTTARGFKTKLGVWDFLHF